MWCMCAQFIINESASAEKILGTLRIPGARGPGLLFRTVLNTFLWHRAKWTRCFRPVYTRASKFARVVPGHTPYGVRRKRSINEISSNRGGVIKGYAGEHLGATRWPARSLPCHDRHGPALRVSTCLVCGRQVGRLWRAGLAALVHPRQLYLVYSCNFTRRTRLNHSCLGTTARDNVVSVDC